MCVRVCVCAFRLTHQYSTGSVATPLPSECRRFPEAMCDAAVGRVLNCLAAHDSPTAPLLPSDPCVPHSPSFPPCS